MMVMGSVGGGGGGGVGVGVGVGVGGVGVGGEIMVRFWRYISMRLERSWRDKWVVCIQKVMRVGVMVLLEIDF
ncbi:hypothetical protein Tco_1299749 [Tanacetum coccineum]